MSKLTIALSLSFAYICVCTLFTSPVSGGSLNPMGSTAGGGNSGVLPSGGSTGTAANRKARILSSNPGLVRLFRLLSRSNGLSSFDDEDILGGEDDSYLQKRQQYDDYGHMRFGKRNPKDFDDYGHMRFGKK